MFTEFWCVRFCHQLGTKGRKGRSTPITTACLVTLFPDGSRDSEEM